MTSESTRSQPSAVIHEDSPDYAIIRPPMTREEAEALTAQIREGIHTMRREAARVAPFLAEMHLRDGWRILGYPSWRAWAMTEFPDLGRSTLYKWLGQATPPPTLSSPPVDNSEAAPVLTSPRPGRGRQLGAKDLGPRYRAGQTPPALPPPAESPANGSMTVYAASQVRPGLEQVAPAASVPRPSGPPAPPETASYHLALADDTLLQEMALAAGEAPGLTLHRILREAYTRWRSPTPPMPTEQVRRLVEPTRVVHGTDVPEGRTLPPAAAGTHWLPQPGNRGQCPRCQKVTTLMRPDSYPGKCPGCRYPLTAPA